MADKITIRVPFSQSVRALGRIGRVGENVSRRILFDCKAALANRTSATIACVIQRPSYDDPYLAPIEETDESGVYSLTLRDVDVAIAGIVKIELRLLDGEEILKAAIYTGVVEPSITADPVDPGNPVADMLDKLESAADTANEAVKQIDAAVTKDNIVSALGYEPVKPEGNYELIETITLTEDTKLVTRTQEPDGTAYKFKDMFVIFTNTVGTTAAVSCGTYVYFNNQTNYGFYLNEGTTFFKNQGYKTMMHIDCTAPTARIIHIRCYNNTMPNAAASVCCERMIEEGDYISSIKFGGSFVAGLQFEIYGVRA